jgi:hypothetical protein
MVQLLQDKVEFCWNLHENEKFSVNSMYRVLVHSDVQSIIIIIIIIIIIYRNWGAAKKCMVPSQRYYFFTCFLYIKNGRDNTKMTPRFRLHWRGRKFLISHKKTKKKRKWAIQQEVPTVAAFTFYLCNKISLWNTTFHLLNEAGITSRERK